MRCCAVFPTGRLLTETDAPYQPLRGREFSTYADLEAIVKTMTALRGNGLTATEMENIVEGNFRAVFGG